MLNQFVHLHTHSNLGNDHKNKRDAHLFIDQYVKRAKELGMSACALTEHGNMHSAMKFYKACKKEDIKPILGVEAYILPKKEMAESEEPSISRIKYHLTLLCKNETGYKQLIKAVSQSYKLKDRNTYPRMTYEDLQNFFVGGHVIALSGCVQGEIPQILLDGMFHEKEVKEEISEAKKRISDKSDATAKEKLGRFIEDKEQEVKRFKKKQYMKAKRKALFLQSIFGKENFYIEIQDHNIDLEKYVLPYLIQLSKETGIPLVATNDAHYTLKEDSHARDIIVALRWNQCIYDEDFGKDCGELYVKSPEEMSELFSNTPTAISNTVKIADQCDITFSSGKHFPKFPVPDAMSEAQYLRKITFEGLQNRFPNFDSWSEEKKQEYIDRIEYELGIITDLNYSGYQLIVSDFIQWARQRGLVGYGRGSAVGSLVCYLTEITDVDPIPYGLYFERYLNKDRVSDPDIDTDFDTDIRDLTIEYVRDKYGANAVANIVTFSTLAARAAIRNAGRATGQLQSLCDRVAKAIPNEPKMTIKKAFDKSPEFNDFYKTNPKARELIDDAILIEGCVIHMGVHAAGVIIADQDITEYVPLMYDNKKEMWITQFDKKTLEGDCGLLKMDFLGLKNLTIVKRTIDDVKRIHGKTVKVREIPLDDKEVYHEIFNKGLTRGVFQFESPGMRELLMRFGTENIEHLILLNASYRPGPMQYLNSILDVRHQKTKADLLCPEIAKIVEQTYGKPIYQEQVMSIFSDLGGFSLGVADIIRRAMSSKKEEKLKEFLPKFKEGLRTLGVSSNDADQFCDEMMEFSKYAFNKSHSTAYSVTAYITAWFKHHYPAEFMANVLNFASNDKLPVYIKECRDMEIPVLPPSINQSGRYFTPTKEGTIRFGLEGIKNVGSSCDDILTERDENGPYKDFVDFIKRMLDIDSRAVYKQVMESLIMAGAFDEFNMTRRQMVEGFYKLIDALKYHRKYYGKDNSRESSLKKADRLVKEATENIYKYIDEYPIQHRLDVEKDIIGFYASGHPLDRYLKTIESITDVSIGDIEVSMDRQEVKLVGLIHDFKQLYRRKDNAPMGKFTLEDLTGEIDCICFTKSYAQYGKLISDDEVIILKGYIDAENDPDSDYENTQVVVQQVEIARADYELFIKLDDYKEWSKIRDIIYDNNDGMTPVYVYYSNRSELRKSKAQIHPKTSFLKDLKAVVGADNVYFG